jgi:hypothetical protein
MIASVCRSAAGVSSWTAPTDLIIRQAFGSAGNYAISSNPSIASTDISAPTTQNRTDIFSCGSGNFHPGAIPLNIPLAAGEVVYVAFSAAGVVQLFLEDSVN